MPDVNDDMDELFKKAAENYPLNTDSSDWNEVYKTLRPLNQPVNNTGDKKNSRRFLWLLLLLIPAAISINKYVFNAEHKNAQAEISSKKHMTSSPEQKNTAKENLNTSEPKEAVHSKAILSTASNISSPSKSIAKKNPAQMVNRILPGDISPEKYSAGEPSNNNIDNGDVPALKSGAYNKIQEGAEVIETGINETAPASNEVATDLDVTKQSNINQSAESKITQQQDKTEPVADTTKQRINNTPKLKGRQQRFYAGIVAGPDFSTIKFQKIIKTGFTAGVIAGYRLNKKLSIESGFFLDKKYYYTKGKYFSTKQVYIPSYTKIEDLDGYCNMTELPLNLKYDFKTNKKISWFALIGSSSYFMKKEFYKYRYLGYGRLMEKELSYKNSSTRWASVINFGAGYSRKAGKTGTLRIEPYIKIPIKSVGIGSMPITSSGVNLGFTKNLF